MKKGNKKIVLMVVFIISILILIIFCILKVNKKINNLSEQIDGYISGSIVVDRSTMIPNLNPQKNGWFITQFGDAGKQQEMCYTISNANGLIIIDGGYEYEVPRLRKIIELYGNSVEAWIISHPHPDHISAFMEIIKDPQGIVIHHVYAVRFPELEILEKNASWDDYTLLSEFRSLDISGLQYVESGDKISILGLEIEVLSTYNENIDALSNDLLNDGSLMFRVNGNKESMLFCSDIGSAGAKRSDVRSELTKYFVEKYGDKLKSDYVQMSHHGFQGLNQEFYEMVDPRAAFFDAPDWLMNGSDWKSTKEKEEMIRRMGAEAYTYYTAPNQILLE